MAKSTRVCPNKNAPEWKTLVDKLGEDGAMRMFMLHEDKPDALSIGVAKLNIDLFKIEEKIDRLTSIAQKVSFDNSPDPKTGEPRHDYYIPNTASPDGRKRLQSVSEVLDLEESTKYRGDDAGNEYSRRGSDVHAVFDMLGKGISEDNILEFTRQRGLPPTFYQGAKSLYARLAKRGRVITEATLSDLSTVAGTGDIILLVNDGTVELYDFKTAHQTRRFQLKPDMKLWDPVAHFGGYKARRYPAQQEFYAKLIENTLGQPVSKKFLIPIEIKYKNYDPSQGYESIEILPEENVDDYGYKLKARKIVDTFFGDYKPEPLPALISDDDSSKWLSNITGRIEDRVADLDKEANDILVTRVKTIRGLLHYKSDKGWTLLNNQTDKAIQKRQIIDEFLSKKESAKRDIVESIKNYMKNGSDPAFIDTPGRVQENLRLLLAKYGGERDIQVYELSDIKGFDKKGNWIVFQEGQSYDLLYMGNDELSSKLSLDKKQGIVRTLFGNYYTGEESRYILGSSLKDTVADAKKFEATLIVMKLKESNPNARFDRVMVYSLNEVSGDMPQAVNLTVMLPIVQKLTTSGRVPDAPASYAKIFAEPSFFDPKSYDQDFVKVYSDFMTIMNKSQDSAVFRGIKQYEKGQIQKERLLDSIASEINFIRSTGKEIEFNHQLYLLSKMSYQLKEIPSDVRPITQFDRWVSMPSNVASPVIQDIFVQIKGAINKIRESFWQGYKKEFIETQKALFKESGIVDAVQDLTISNTTRYYEPLFRKVDKNVRQEDGQVKAIKTNTFEFKEEGSDEFLALSKAQQNYITKANDAIQAAASIAGIQWVRGRIPLVNATFMNRFYRASSGNSTLNASQAYQEALTRLFDSMEENFGLGETRAKSDHDLFLTNLFQSQANTQDFEGRRPEMLGFTQDGYVEPEIHAQYETNMEVVIDLFMMNAIRVKEFNKVASVFSTAKTLFELQRANFFDEGLERNINWVEVWHQAMLNNRDVDSGTLPNRAVRGVNKVASAFLIGFKPATAIISYLGQELTATSQALANTLSKADGFKLSHWTKAGTIIFNPRNKEKVDLLLEQYGMFDLDLNALVNGRRRYGNRSLFKSKFLYGLLNAGDWATRAQILTSQMLYDGSWDAYSVQDGELVYDEDKDSRFTTSDGKLIKEAIKEQLAKEGHLTGREEDAMDIRRMMRAYDDRLANRLKFQADQLVGGFDRETRGLYQYNALGKLLGLFKTWLPARLNRGFDREFESMVNGNYVIEEDNTGKKQVVWRGRQMEGIMHSLLAAIYYVRNIHNKQNQVPLTKGQQENLYRLMSDAIMIGIAMVGFMGLPDDDDDTRMDDGSADMLRASISDLLSVYNIFQATELLYTPVAVEFADKTLSQIWGILSNVPNPEVNTTSSLLEAAPITRHYTWLMDELNDE